MWAIRYIQLEKVHRSSYSLIFLYIFMKISCRRFSASSYSIEEIRKIYRRSLLSYSEITSEKASGFWLIFGMSFIISIKSITIYLYTSIRIFSESYSEKIYFPPRKITDIWECWWALWCKVYNFYFPSPRRGFSCIVSDIGFIIFSKSSNFPLSIKVFLMILKIGVSFLIKDMNCSYLVFKLVGFFK